MKFFIASRLDRRIKTVISNNSSTGEVKMKISQPYSSPIDPNLIVKLYD